MSRSHAPRQGWLLWLLLYIILLYIVMQVIPLPEQVQVKQRLEAALSVGSMVFLVLHLLSLIVLTAGKSGRPFPWGGGVALIWSVSLFYHFFLWLLSTQANPPGPYYQVGTAFTLGALLLTLSQFLTHISSGDRLEKSMSVQSVLEKRKEAYKTLKQIFTIYRLIREVSEADPEVMLLLKWNHYNSRMEDCVREVEPFLQSSSFSPSDLEQIFGVKAWLDSLLIIIEEHPSHRDLHKQVWVEGVSHSF